MKEYPSIPASTGQSFREFKAHVFDKYDGSNLRVEWTKKNGWYKFGTRTRLVDHTDPTFGVVPELFMNQWAESLEKVLVKQRYERALVFMEFWGEKSFAGQHEDSDPKFLTPIDVNVHKQGILGPRDFLKQFGHLDVARLIGEFNWTRDFVRRVREGEIEGITFEGVVGKGGEGHKLVMAKAKTQSWIDAVKARFTEEEANKIINS